MSIVSGPLSVAQAVENVQVVQSSGFAGFVQTVERVSVPATKSFVDEFPFPAGTVTGPTISKFAIRNPQFEIVSFVVCLLPSDL